MADKDKAPYGEADKEEKTGKENPKTGESTAPYGEGDETPSTKPAKDEDRDIPTAG